MGRDTRSPVRFVRRFLEIRQAKSLNPLKAFRRGIPTLWEHFSHSPTRWLVQKAYKSYASVTKPITLERGDPQVPVVRVVCISDTHNRHNDLPPLPEGDILIHAGDLTDTGSQSEILSALSWLAAQPHPHKVFIAGNHDTLLAEPLLPRLIRVLHPELIYLQDSSVTLEVRGHPISVYGSPRTPLRSGRGVFQYARWDGTTWTRRIPTATDILVTHGPPQYHGDVAGLGCNDLRYELWRVRPRLHVFGHIHAGRGVERAAYSPVQLWYEGLCKGRQQKRFGWTAALKVVRAALQRAAGIEDERTMKSPAGRESILVNASSVSATRGGDLLEPIVVDVALTQPSKKERRRRRRASRELEA